jgi:hypothetical protein
VDGVAEGGGQWQIISRLLKKANGPLINADERG